MHSQSYDLTIITCTVHVYIQCYEVNPTNTTVVTTVEGREYHTQIEHITPMPEHARRDATQPYITELIITV